MDQKKYDIDFEKQIFDEIELNPYEIVIAVSKKAREINDKAQKYLPPETSVNSIFVALKKLENEETKFVYDDENEETDTN